MSEIAVDGFGHIREKGFAASTRNKYVQMVKALFRRATKKGYLDAQPRGRLGRPEAPEACPPGAPAGAG